MNLTKLLSHIAVQRIAGSSEREITGIAYDSRHVKPGSLFVAVKGEKTDGSAFIPQAIEAGASAVLGEQPGEHSKATMITVGNARQAMADVACAYYDNPSHHLKTTAVTGTNGKTTFTFLLKHLCERAIMPSGLIGTVRYEIGNRILPATRTTPESLDLQEMLAQVRNAGCRAAVMEASSHALVLERLRGVELDAAVFTNLTQDHLDFHGTMERYFEAKTLLFSRLLEQKKKKGVPIINLDDRFGARLAQKFSRDLPVVTYGQGLRADFRASSVRIDYNGTTYQLDAKGRSFLVRMPLMGRFNVANSLAALAAASALEINLRDAVNALADAPSVPGRVELVPGRRNFKVFVDYAHTPDALVNVMKTLRELQPSRLIVVFGCGGNRDRAKRALMASAVEQAADIAIITSDNPRKEDPLAIIEDIKKGFTGKNYLEFPDRQHAIEEAIHMARERDIVLIAGKGHENYQEFADRTVPFDDVEVASQALAQLRRE